MTYLESQHDFELPEILITNWEKWDRRNWVAISFTIIFIIITIIKLSKEKVIRYMSLLERTKMDLKIKPKV